MTKLPPAFNISFMVDKYFYKREKVASLLFDLVKYLLTALAATVLFTEKLIPIKILILIGIIVLFIFILAIAITPKKED